MRTRQLAIAGSGCFFRSLSQVFAAVRELEWDVPQPFATKVMVIAATPNRKQFLKKVFEITLLSPLRRLL